MIRLSGLTGVLSGSAIVALGFIASVVIAPPESASVVVRTAPMVAAPAASAPSTAPQPAPDTPPLRQGATPATTAEGDTQSAPDGQARADTAPSPPKSTTPDMRADLPATASARLPEADTRQTRSRLPTIPPSPRGSSLPNVATSPVPAASDPDRQPDSVEDDRPAIAEPASQDPATEALPLPGARVTGLPGQSATPTLPEPDTASDPDEAVLAATALERNSSFTGPLTGAPLMAVVLNDPGLPTPLRRSLAALDLPITIALNPMDPSAPQAATIYRDAGKEVLILANGLPAGARATDLDVTLGAWFAALPQAVGVLDLPVGGFARNAGLTAGVLPLIARDGHGLVSFAGGLSRMATAAERAGVAHAEVFRVLDDEGQSAFTIRRYLDRAVFQASQIGTVVVFGDATNDATMEALDLWRSEGRIDQVAVVPISAILMTR